MHYIECTEGVRETAWTVCQWFMEEYLSDYKVYLTVDEKDLSGEGVDGWCIRETDNEFLIQLDINLVYDFVPTLLHELYHVLQWLEGKDRNEWETFQMEGILLDRYMNRD